MSNVNVTVTVNESKREWSAFQLAIFRDIAEGRGHTVVRARAGSGKSSTIVEGFRHVPAGLTVLMAAFNKDIATSLKERAPRSVEVSTLHSYGLRQVTKALGKLRINGNRTGGIIKGLVGRGTSEKNNYEYRRALGQAVSLAKGTLSHTEREVDALLDQYEIDTADPCAPADASPERVREVFVGRVLTVMDLCKDTRKDGALDFDDMVWLPIVHNVNCYKFDRVFIDEAQDMNKAQIELAVRALKAGGRFCAVGDDRQAIYGFRGADHEAIGNIVRRFNAKVLPLSVTYRCAKSIVRIAQEIVADLEHAPHAAEGQVLDMTDKEMIQAARPGDFILSRANAPLVGHCLSFLKEGRKASIQGRDIGAQLATLIKKCPGHTTVELTAWIDAWAATEIERLAAKNPPGDTQATEDKRDTVHALAEGEQTVAGVLAKIEALFSDVSDDAKIVLSTTHKAKGLERERAFVLADTYQKRPGVEESNLFYVAVTRAKTTLVLVHKPTEGERPNERTSRPETLGEDESDASAPSLPGQLPGTSFDDEGNRLPAWADPNVVAVDPHGIKSGRIER